MALIEIINRLQSTDWSDELVWSNQVSLKLRHELYNALKADSLDRYITPSLLRTDDLFPET